MSQSLSETLENVTDSDPHAQQVQSDTAPDENDETHSRFKADSKVYKSLYIGCGAIILWLIIDLWVIMSDKKPMLPYYLEPTDSIKKEDKDRKLYVKE